MTCPVNEDVKAGVRVRVVMEGVVNHTSTGKTAPYFVMGDSKNGSTNAIEYRSSHVVSVEILPDPIAVGDLVVGRSSGRRYEVLAINEGYAWCRKCDDGAYLTFGFDGLTKEK
jgi:hypothetical protein